jgi:hypothetical protein
MGITELAGRGRQEGLKWLERAEAGRGRRPLSDGILLDLAAEHVPAAISAGLPRADLLEAARALLDTFRKRAPGRFFPGASSPSTPALLAGRMPEARARTLAAAEAIGRKRFDLLGHRGLFFGDPVDWRLDPISRRRSQPVHWSRIDPLDARAVGDSKVVWELNRHQWLVRLGQAFGLSGDEAHATAFAEHIRDWLRVNPPGIGINWASSLEVALRLISWCWALVLFRESAALSPGLFLEVLGGIRAHAEHVRRYLSRYFSPNTHLTGEALGLFYAGVLFPELRAAERWRALGARILVRESGRQVLSDGVYFEQSTCYQRYTVEIYLHFLMLAARNGVRVPPDVEARVVRMIDCLLAVRRPDGSLPSIGDADGGWLLPFDVREPGDPRGLFATAAALLGRPAYAWAAGGAQPEVLWLLGPEGLESLEALDPVPPATAPSRLFPAGGYAVMRDSWSPQSHQLIFDVGPLGCAVSGGHGHADLLSIQCCAFGKPFLEDAGTYCYTPEPAWRDFFRSTFAHSTVIVDGVGQAAPAGPFGWESQPGARLLRWLSTDDFDYAEAEHDGYRRLRDPVVHRRRVLFVKPRYWVVVDELDGRAEHRVELRFQFGPLVVTVDPALWARAYGTGRHDLHVRPFASVALEAEIREGWESPIEGWVAPNYGRRRMAPMLVYSASVRLPIRIVTLLLPADRPFAPRPAVSALQDSGPGPIGILIEEPREKVRFDEAPFIVERG